MKRGAQGRVTIMQDYLVRRILYRRSVSLSLVVVNKQLMNSVQFKYVHPGGDTNLRSYIHEVPNNGIK
jgi:hypothetical protein